MPKKLFTPNDPRIHKGGRPKKKTFSDILEELGTVTIKDKETGKIIDKLEGNDRLLKEIVNVGIKEKNPAMMKFIYQHLNAPQYDGELLEIKKQVEKARAAKIELENEIKNKRAAMRAEMESYDAAIKKSRAEQEEMKTKKMTGAYINFETMRYYFSFFQRAITDSYAGIKKISRDAGRLYKADKAKEAEKVLMNELYICFGNAVKALEAEIEKDRGE